VCGAQCDSDDDCDDDDASTIDTCNLDSCGCEYQEIELIEKDAKVAYALPASNFGLGRYMIVNPKQRAYDRAYVRVNAIPLLGSTYSDAKLKLAVYYTGNNVVGTNIDAWYCPDHDFVETLINWYNQPLDDVCVLVDTYTVPNTVVAGIPETWHEYEITDELNDELNNGDGKFTIVLISQEEGAGVPNNGKYVQYLTKDYPEEEYRPKLDLTI